MILVLTSLLRCPHKRAILLVGNRVDDYIMDVNRTSMGAQKVVLTL